MRVAIGTIEANRSAHLARQAHAVASLGVPHVVVSMSPTPPACGTATVIHLTSHPDSLPIAAARRGRLLCGPIGYLDPLLTEQLTPDEHQTANARRRVILAADAQRSHDRHGYWPMPDQLTRFTATGRLRWSPDSTDCIAL